MARVLVIPDLQAPFQHKNALKFLIKVYRMYQCDTVICIGDEVDFKFLKYANSNDPHSPMGQHYMALAFLHQLYKAFPVVKCCHSNHVIERLNYASNLGSIPKYFIKDLSEIMEAPKGWEWGDYFVIDGVRYEHGHHIKGGQRSTIVAVQQRHQSVVFGHHPLLEVRFTPVNGKQLFGFCVSALTVDPSDKDRGYGMEYALKYGREMPKGCGVVIDGIYAFPLPMV